MADLTLVHSYYKNHYEWWTVNEESVDVRYNCPGNSPASGEHTLTRNEALKNFALMVGCEGWTVDEFSDEWNDFLQKQRNLMTELKDIENELMREIGYEISKANKDFSCEDELPLEFFSFKNCDNIKVIQKDGTVVFDNVSEPISILSVLDNGDIDLYDAASLLNELRELGNQ